MKEWHWGAALQREFDRWEIEVDVVKKIPPHHFGSSIDSSIWTGERLIVEQDAWTPWVAHELAHFLVCRRNSPQLLKTRNWGFDYHRHVLSELDISENRFKFRSFNQEETQEFIAADVTVGLLIELKYPWIKACLRLNISDETGSDPFEEHTLASPKGRARVKAFVLEKSKIYLDQEPSP